MTRFYDGNARRLQKEEKDTQLWEIPYDFATDSSNLKSRLRFGEIHRRGFTRRKGVRRHLQHRQPIMSLAQIDE
jgi:hypothetical protein